MNDKIIVMALMETARKLNAEVFEYYTFAPKGDLHRNVLLQRLENNFGITFRDYDLSPTGIKAKNIKTENVLKRLFNKHINGNKMEIESTNKKIAKELIEIAKVVNAKEEWTQPIKIEMRSIGSGLYEFYLVDEYRKYVIHKKIMKEDDFNSEIKPMIEKLIELCKKYSK